LVQLFVKLGGSERGKKAKKSIQDHRTLPMRGGEEEQNLGQRGWGAVDSSVQI